MFRSGRTLRFSCRSLWTAALFASWAGPLLAQWASYPTAVSLRQACVTSAAPA